MIKRRESRVFQFKKDSLDSVYQIWEKVNLACQILGTIYKMCEYHKSESYGQEKYFRILSNSWSRIPHFLAHVHINKKIKTESIDVCIFIWPTAFKKSKIGSCQILKNIPMCFSVTIDVYCQIKNTWKMYNFPWNCKTKDFVLQCCAECANY